MVVVVGSHTNSDFDAQDHKPARAIYLILTLDNDLRSLLDISSELGGLFCDPRMLGRVTSTRSFAGFPALPLAPV